MLSVWLIGWARAGWLAKDRVPRLTKHRPVSRDLCDEATAAVSRWATFAKLAVGPRLGMARDCSEPHQSHRPHTLAASRRRRRTMEAAEVRVLAIVAPRPASVCDVGVVPAPTSPRPLSAALLGSGPGAQSDTALAWIESADGATAVPGRFADAAIPAASRHRRRPRDPEAAFVTPERPSPPAADDGGNHPSVVELTFGVWLGLGAVKQKMAPPAMSAIWDRETLR